MMFENIEKVIREQSGYLHIEEERYGSGLLAGFDIGAYKYVNNATDDSDATIVYAGSELRDSIDAATAPGDMAALAALFKLVDFAEQHPEFLFARAETLEEVLAVLEVRAGLWNQLSIDQQKKMMLNFAAFEGDPFNV